MKPRFNSLRYSLAASLAIGFSGTSVSATSFYFDGGTIDINTDGNGASAGASGNWNTTVKNWDQGVAAHFVWNNTTNAGDTAVFGTTNSRTVTVSDTVIADTVQIGALSWTFNGGTIDANNFDATTKANTTLNSNLTGTINFKATGWTGDLSDSGAVIINGNNTGLTSTTVNFNQDANHLVLNHAGALGADGADVQIAKGVVNLGNTAATAISYNKWDIDLNGGAIRGRFGIQTINGPVTVTADSWLLTRAGADAGQDPKLVFSSTATIDLGANTLSLHAAKVVDNGGIELNGVISGTGGLTQATSTLSDVGVANGTVILNANNTYTGDTLVNNGTMAINGDQSAATGNVGVSGTGTRLIGSNGTVGGNTTINSGAIHSAGGAIANTDKVGIQTFDQAGAGTTSLTYGAGSIFEWDLNEKKDTDSGGTRGTDYDAVDVTGTLTVNSTAIFRVVLGTGATTGDLSFWQQNQTWSDIFSGGFTLSGSGYNNSLLQVVDAATGSTFNVNTLFSGAGSGFSVSGTTLTWTAVPEPTSALAGLLITAGLLRRRRA